MPPRQRPSILAYLVSFGLIATLPLTALLGYNLYSQYQADRRDAIALIEPLRLAFAQQIRTYVGDMENLLVALSRSSAVQSGDRTDILTGFNKVRIIRPDLGNLALLADGTLIMNGHFLPENAPAALPEYAWLHAELTHDTFHLSPAFFNPATQQWTCLASHPVQNAGGRRIGTLLILLDLGELSRRFFGPDALPHTTATVFDAQGTRLMHSSDLRMIGGASEYMHPAFKKDGTGHLVSTFTPADGEPQLYTIGSIPNTPWSNSIAMPRRVVFASAIANQRRSLGLFAGFVVLLGIAITWLARSLNRPIVSLAHAARAEIENRPIQPALVAGPAEIAETARAFNDMVAARERSERILAENEHRYRTVIDQTGQMIYDLDVATSGIRWFGTEAIPAITGHTLEEFQSVDLARWESMIHPEDRPHALALLDEALQHGKPYEVEYRFQHRNGSYRYLEDRGVFLRNSAGQIDRMLGRMSDISARKLAVTTLRQIIDLVPHYIFAKDAGGRFVLANRAVAEAYGTTPENLIGKTDAHFLGDSAEVRWFIAKDRAVLESGQPLTIPEEHHTDHRGRIRTLTTVKIPFVFADGGQPTVLGVSVDITEFKKVASERQQIEKKLLETQKLESLGVLAGGIAHDFNNLLTGIIGHAGLARLDLPPESTALECIEHIEQTSLRAADLCKQMLAYSGKGRFVVQSLDLNALLRETTQLLTVSINKKALLRFNLEPTLPPIQADATQLRQIVMNLVINASEAIGDRPGTITLSTGCLKADGPALLHAGLATELAPGDYIYLEVVDDGIGMTTETAERIFDPFYTTKFTGRGLGLAAVQGIVHGHKGAIRVSSELGRGTTFKLYFPSIKGPAETLPEPAPRVSHWRGSGRALVVDDDDSVRRVATQLITRLGYTVDQAPDGLAALEIFKNRPADYTVVLLDLTMPNLDGEETFRRLREIDPQVRIILMSGFNKVEAINRFLGKGLAGFVQKPFELDTLTAELRRVAENKPAATDDPV